MFSIMMPARMPTGAARTRERGATLLEMLAGLAILGILIGLASAGLTGRTPKYRLLKTVREIHSRMNHARYKAIYTGTKIRLRLETTSYRLETWDRNLGTWIRGPERFVEGVRIEANNTPTFHPMGTVSNLCSIHLTNSWGHFKLSLAITGRVKIVRLEPPP
jgi:prepilin-type N-terminal cleavage/methylation domain-containing protein